MNDTNSPLNTNLKIDLPVKQVRAYQAWQSALIWWARAHPGQPVNIGILVRRSALSRATAYRYLTQARASGLVTSSNVPVLQKINNNY